MLVGFHVEVSVNNKMLILDREGWHLNYTNSST